MIQLGAREMQSIRSPPCPTVFRLPGQRQTLRDGIAESSWPSDARTQAMMEQVRWRVSRSADLPDRRSVNEAGNPSSVRAVLSGHDGRIVTARSERLGSGLKQDLAPSAEPD